MAQEIQASPETHRAALTLAPLYALAIFLVYAVGLAEPWRNAFDRLPGSSAAVRI